MPACPFCRGHIAVDAAYCSSCGSSLTNKSVRKRSSSSSIKFDWSALTVIDRVAGVANVVLFVSLFLSWFNIEGHSLGSGLNSHGYLYIPLIIAIVTFITFFLRVTDMGDIAFGRSPERTLAIASLVSFVLVLVGFLDKPGGLGGGFGVGWSFGAYLGLIASIVALAALARPFMNQTRGR